MYDKIFDIVLVLINFIFLKINDRERAIKKFREVFQEIEKTNESSIISEETERLIKEANKPTEF